MKYPNKSFSVPMSGGPRKVCDQHGHMEPDRYGKCLRCAERIESPSRAMRERAEHDGATLVEYTTTIRVSRETLEALGLHPPTVAEPDKPL